MKELLTEFLSNLLNEREVRKPNSTWQTAGGKWSAKRTDGTTEYGFESEKAARAWLAGGKKSAAPEKIGGRELTAMKKDRRDRAELEKGLRKGTKPEKPKKTSASKPEPIVTPGGNKIDNVLSPRELVAVETQVRAKVDEKRSVSDDLADVDIERHQSRTLPKSSEDYYAEMQARGFVSDPIQRFDDPTRQTLRSAGVPDTHVDLLERAINTRLDGEIPPFTELTGGSAGAGKPSSQAGEILAMTLMAVPAAQRGAVSDAIMGMVKNSGTDSPMLDKTWVTAGVRQAEAFDSMMDIRYGEGNWTVESTAWDTPEDIAGIGLSKENKGFSTDVALRIRVQGKPQAQVARLSLKKDGNIFLLNGSTTDVVSYSLQTLSPEEKSVVFDIQELLPKIDKDETARRKMEQVLGAKEGTSKKVLRELAKKRLVELQNKAMDLLPINVRQKVEVVTTFPERQQASAENLSTSFSGRDEVPNDVVSAVARANRWNVRDTEFAKTAHAALRGASTVEEAREALKRAGIPADKEDRFRKAVVYASMLEAERDPAMRKELDRHLTMAVECGNASLDATLEDENMMSGLMLKLQETFPIRVIASGEESMCLGGVPVSRETLKEMFGTDDPDEIQQGLTVATNQGPPEERILIFQSEGANGRRIPIATVQARQRGRGYEGTVGLEFKATPQFECAAAMANAQIGMSRSANQRIVDKCGKKNKLEK